VPSTQLFPEVIDASTLGAKFASPLYLPIGVEGWIDAATGGDAVVGQIYTITTPAEAEARFGTGTLKLPTLVKFLLGRGVAPIYATASKRSVTVPSLAERQAAWQNLESDSRVRIRMTDSETQADLVALADSAEYAELINNKQFAIMGMISATSKTSLITAAGAIGSKRGVLVGPGVYDNAGVLISGLYAAAAVAAEVAKNPDPSDDLDTLTLPNLTGIEKDAQGMPIFRRKVVAGVAANDFEDLLQGGVSPLMTGRNGGVDISHLRTTWVTDGTFDSLMTRIIADQVFVDVRNYLYSQNFLRSPNTPTTRERIRSGVDALLLDRREWISPKVQPDGKQGYNVQVTSSADERQVTVAYEGKVVRGISTIQVAASLEISV
jgi:hypothetical protein